MLHARDGKKLEVLYLLLFLMYSMFPLLWHFLTLVVPITQRRSKKKHVRSFWWKNAVTESVAILVWGPPGIRHTTAWFRPHAESWSGVNACASAAKMQNALGGICTWGVLCWLTICRNWMVYNELVNYWCMLLWCSIVLQYNILALAAALKCRPSPKQEWSTGKGVRPIASLAHEYKSVWLIRIFQKNDECQYLIMLAVCVSPIVNCLWAPTMTMWAEYRLLIVEKGRERGRHSTELNFELKHTKPWIHWIYIYIYTVLNA